MASLLAARTNYLFSSLYACLKVSQGRQLAKAAAGATYTFDAALWTRREGLKSLDPQGPESSPINIF